MSSDRIFGISTHLFHEQRLTREHLVHIAAHGFEAIELFATRAHVDYHDRAMLAQIAEWLNDTRVELHSVHAPIVDAIRNGEWVGSYSIASGDETRRKAAVAEIRAAAEIAATIPFRYLVVHIGMPAVENVPPGDNQPQAARRSIEEIASIAEAAGVKVALEVIGNALSEPVALVDLLEEQLEEIDVGICLDYGHVNVMGDVADAIETLSGHIWTTHLHDNGGRRDDHLVPYAGAINWDNAMMQTQKVGYDGVLMFEVAGGTDPVATLQRCAKARERLEKTLIVF